MPLPVCVSNFRELITNKDPNQEGYLFVDKTAKNSRANCC